MVAPADGRRFPRNVGCTWYRAVCIESGRFWCNKPRHRDIFMTWTDEPNAMIISTAINHARRPRVGIGFIAVVRIH